MKKTLIALLALSSVAVADYELHGITFNKNVTGKPMQNQVPNDSNMYIDNGTGWGAVNDMKGLYLTSTSGFQNNNQSADVNISYLYIDPSIAIADIAGCQVGHLAWQSTGANMSYNIRTDGWVDIDADYGSRIGLHNMAAGSVYLNKSGALTLTNNGSAYTLNSGVTVYASSETDFLGTRTLMTGDFSDWMGTITITAGNDTATWTNGQITQATGVLSNISFSNGAAGLSYTISAVPAPTPSVPEPATGTLSLLALAGLCARRRRK